MQGCLALAKFDGQFLPGLRPQGKALEEWEEVDEEGAWLEVYIVER